MENLVRVELLVVMVLISGLMVYIHVNDKIARPLMWALLPGAIANVIFYVVSVALRYSASPLPHNFVNSLSIYRVQAVAIPALVILSFKAHDIWTGRR